MPDESKLRAFISYSHSDRPAFEAVNATLRALGLAPWSDQDLEAGHGFTEQIQTKIAHSHLFVPILTPESHNRGWVHQEIGFAVALKVPCVPICIGRIPEGMIAMAHAVVFGDDADLSQLEEKIGRVRFVHLVQAASRELGAPSDCAQEPEDRALMIERYADEAHFNLGPSCVRIHGGMSSFSLPDESPEHPAWRARYADQPRSPNAYKLLRRERRSLEQHARAGGLGLIAHVGLDVDGHCGPGAKRARLCILKQFLESLRGPEERFRVALVSEHPPDLFLAVGDWFTAESRAPRPVRGVVQTVFTVHAPSVGRRLQEFDADLGKLLEARATPPIDSRQAAIAELDGLIRNLPRHAAWSCE